MSAYLHKHEKLITLILVMVYILSLIPILMIAPYAAAAGDDYNYGAAAHQAFLSTGSIWAAIQAAVQTTVGTWYGWQGTWFDCFVFCLHPEVFSDSLYVLVPYIFVTLQIICFMIFAHHFIKIRFKISGQYWLQLALIVLIFGFQLVPSQKSAFFWWVGSVHYAMPMCMSLIGIVLGDRYLVAHKTSDLVLLSIIATLMGGATYPAVLLLILAVFLLWLADFVIGHKKFRTDLLLLIPFVLELIGLILSVIAPGNAVRSASDLSNGGSPSGGVVATVIGSIIFSVKDAFGYFIFEKTFVLIAFIGIALLSKDILLCRKKEAPEEFKDLFSHPVLFLLVMFLLNASMYAPRLYAGGVVSSGYYNFNFWVFFICVTASIIYVSGWICSLIDENSQRHNRISASHRFIAIVAFLMLIAFFGRHGVKEYTDYVCLDYFLTGQADDYKEQIALQRFLMEEDGVDDVVLPAINDEQGPLMHMPVVEDPLNVDNIMTKGFYGKNSCRSIPREAWMEQYQDKYQAFLQTR